MRSCNCPASVIQLAAEAVAACDAIAITPYLKVLDWLDRYQMVASANEVHDEEARKKLMDKTNRMAANFGVDEVIAAAVQEHLKEIGEIPNDEPSEADGDGAGERTPADVTAGTNGPDSPHPRAEAESGFFI